MHYIKLKVTSKNNESLLYLYNHLFSRTDLTCNFNVLKKKFKTATVKKRITLLKAPHINKSAQEHFEIRYYNEEYYIQVTNYVKFLKYIKKLRDDKLVDTKFKISLLTGNKKQIFSKICLKYFYTKINYVIQLTHFTKKFYDAYRIQKYLISFDLKGELSL